MQQFVIEKENISRQYESLREVVDAKHERIKDLAKSRVESSTTRTESSAMEGLSDSRTAYALSLYTKISNITWNYENSENIAGCKYMMFN